MTEAKPPAAYLLTETNDDAQAEWRGALPADFLDIGWCYPTLEAAKRAAQMAADEQSEAAEEPSISLTWETTEVPSAVGAKVTRHYATNGDDAWLIREFLFNQ